MLELKNVQVSIGSKTILKNINLQIDDGDICILKGANGSGKSLFLKTICYGQNKNIKSSFKSTGVVIEKSKLVPHMKGREFLYFLNKLSKVDIKANNARAEKLIKLFDIEEEATKKIANYSLGTTHKFALIQAFMHNPELILLDEPFDSLDKKSITILLKLINDEIANGKTFIIVDHNNDLLIDKINVTKTLEINNDTINLT